MKQNRHRLDLLSALVFFSIACLTSAIMMYGHPNLISTTLVLWQVLSMMTFSTQYRIHRYRNKLIDDLYLIMKIVSLTNFVAFFMDSLISGNQININIIWQYSLFELFFIMLWLLLLRTLMQPDDKVLSLLIIAKEENHSLLNMLHQQKQFPIIESIHPDSERLFLKLHQAQTIMLGSIDSHDKKTIINLCMAIKKQVLLVPDSIDMAMMSSTYVQMNDMTLLALTPPQPSFMYQFAKRAMDIGISGLGLILLSPLWILCAILIYRQDHHSPLFKQERLTLHGRPFWLYKFRTMIINAEEEGTPLLATHDDHRITKLGHFLRSTRLDEMPQLINILKGDMSLVGPRPEREYFYQQYEKEVLNFRDRLWVKAGLSGYAQVRGRYATTPNDKLNLDMIYIRNQSLLFDCRILLETVSMLFRKEAASGQSTVPASPSPKGQPEEQDSNLMNG